MICISVFSILLVFSRLCFFAFLEAFWYVCCCYRTDIHIRILYHFSFSKVLVSVPPSATFLTVAEMSRKTVFHEVSVTFEKIIEERLNLKCLATPLICNLIFLKNFILNYAKMVTINVNSSTLPLFNHGPQPPAGVFSSGYGCIFCK